jgi:hypothetical protein
MKLIGAILLITLLVFGFGIGMDLLQGYPFLYFFTTGQHIFMVLRGYDYLTIALYLFVFLIAIRRQNNYRA